MKNKIIVGFGISLLLVLLIVEQFKPERVKTGETASDPSVKIGMVVNDAAQDHYQEAYYEIMEDYAEENGVNLVLMDSQGNIEKQKDQVRSLINMKCDCIVIWPVNSEEAVASARAVSEAGIPCMTANTKIASEGEQYLKCHVGPSCYEESRIVAEEMINQLGDDIKIAEIRGPEGYASSAERTEALQDVIEGTGIEILDSQSSEGSRAKGQQIAEEYLEKYDAGKLDAIFTYDDNTAYGIWNAIEEAGRQGDVKIYAVAAGKYDTLNYVRDGKIAAAAVQSPCFDVEDTLDMAIHLAKGGRAERFENHIDTPLLTRETVDQLYLQEW